jgi:hypothetical protein
MGLASTEWRGSLNMLKSRSRGLAAVLAVGALVLAGAGTSARMPDRPHKGFAPLCLLGAPPAECTDGPIS